MDKGLKIFFVFLLILMILVLVLQNNMPQAVNRQATYHHNDKIPLGLYVLRQEYDRIFRDAFVYIWPNTFFEYTNDELYEEEDDEYQTNEIKDSSSYDTTLTEITTLESDSIYHESSYDESLAILYINRYFDWDNASVKSLFSYVREGSHAFISALSFTKQIKDSLNIQIAYSSKTSDFENILKESGDSIPAIEGNWPYSGVYFDLDSLANFEVLGYTCADDGKWMPNCVKIPYGNGEFILHCEPAIFSNYTLLNKDSYKQAEYLLTLLNNNFIVWVAPGQSEKPLSGSALRFVKSQPPLCMAWYIIIAGFLLLMIFNAKRWQRSVPVYLPNVNTSEDFVKTISNLYQLEGSVRDIMDKKIIFFLEKVRSRYLLSTENLNETFIQKLHLKSQCTIKEAERIVFLIKKHRDSDYTCTHEDLRRLNTAMEAVK